MYIAELHVYPITSAGQLNEVKVYVICRALHVLIVVYLLFRQAFSNGPLTGSV